MADFRKIVADKTEADSTWKERRNAERDNATTMQDEGVMEITSNPAEYDRYLMMQGDNPNYSVGNIVIVMFQKQDFTVIGTPERWRKLGRTVIESESANGVKIFARASMNNGNPLADAYDIKQTTGKEFKQLSLADDSKEMEQALAKLLNFSSVPVSVDDSIGVPAYYDDKEMELVINDSYPDGKIFAAIIEEVVYSRIHQKGRNPHYSREESRLDAQSVSYIMCRRYGIEREVPDLDDLTVLYDGWSSEERRQALDSMQDICKRMGNSIDYEINTPNKSTPAKRQVR